MFGEDKGQALRKGDLPTDIGRSMMPD